jgi:hypothetical protein
MAAAFLEVEAMAEEATVAVAVVAVAQLAVAATARAETAGVTVPVAPAEGWLVRAGTVVEKVSAALEATTAVVGRDPEAEGVVNPVVDPVTGTAAAWTVAAAV